MKRPLIPPPTSYDGAGRPSTKWDRLAEAEPPRSPSPGGMPKPCRGLSDERPLAGMPAFVKRFT